MMRVAAAWTFLLASGATIGCSGDGAPVLLENPQFPEVRADSVVLELGSYDGAHDAFTRVAAVIPGEEGTLALLLHPENEVRIFDETGQFLRRFGGTGQGPGEFAGSSLAGTLDDRMWILDTQLRRISFFDWNGALEGTLSLPEPPTAHSDVRWRRVGVVAGDRLILRPAAPRRLESDSLPVLSIGLSDGGETIDTVFRVARPAATPPAVQVGGVFLSAAGSDQVRDPVTADHTLVATAFDGRSVVLVERHEDAEPGHGLVRLLRLSLSGELMAETRFHRARVAGPARAPAPPGAESDFAPFLDYLYQEEHAPVVTEMRAGVDGSVWLGVEGLNAVTGLWWVFDEALRPMYQVRLDEASELVQVAADRIWTIERDAVGVPRVIVRALEPLTEGTSEADRTPSGSYHLPEGRAWVMGRVELADEG